jgi:hypothetical protein
MEILSGILYIIFTLIILHQKQLCENVNICPVAGIETAIQVQRSNQLIFLSLVSNWLGFIMQNVNVRIVF